MLFSLEGGMQKVLLLEEECRYLEIEGTYIWLRSAKYGEDSDNLMIRWRKAWQSSSDIIVCLNDQAPHTDLIFFFFYNTWVFSPCSPARSPCSPQYLRTCRETNLHPPTPSHNYLLFLVPHVWELPLRSTDCHYALMPGHHTPLNTYTHTRTDWLTPSHTFP